MSLPMKGFDLRTLRRTLTAALAAGALVLCAGLLPAQGPPRGGSFGAPPLAGNEAQPATFAQRPLTEGAARPDNSESPVVTGEVFEPGEVLAIVGDQFVLAADVLPQVNQVLEPYRGKGLEDQLKQQRRILIAQLTAAHVEVKILYLSFLRKAPPEQIEKVQKKLEVNFNKELEEIRQKVETASDTDMPALVRKDPQLTRLAILMKEAGVWSTGELDGVLRKYGGTLAQEKRYFGEYTLGRVMIHQSINRDPQVSHDEMLTWYQEHQKDYEVPVRVKFEIMSVRFEKFRTRQEAEQAICSMGNEVLGGASFEAVARRSSQGLNADKGGLHDWTPRGALASKVLEEALFTIEPGSLSQVIDDGRGLHIVRVIERQEAGKVPFSEAQTKIREKIEHEKFQKQYKELVVKLKDGVQVWTVFDDDPLLSRAVRADERKKR